MKMALTDKKRIMGELIAELGATKNESLKDVFYKSIDLLKHTEKRHDAGAKVDMDTMVKMKRLAVALIMLIPANKPVLPGSLYARLSPLITSLQITARKDQWSRSVDRATDVVKHFPCVDDVYTGHCPDCGTPLLRFGHRDRSIVDEAGEKEVFDLRRLRCKSCRKVHIELLDCMVPYHRHSAVVVEAALDGMTDKLIGSQISEWNIPRLRRRIADMGGALVKEAVGKVRDRLAVIKAFCGGNDGWVSTLTFRLVTNRLWRAPVKMGLGAGKPLQRK